MADLTPDKRKKMAAHLFAMPGDRFPINDAEHAKLAIGGATRAEHAGNISPGQKAMIDRKAESKLKK